MMMQAGNLCRLSHATIAAVAVLILAGSLSPSEAQGRSDAREAFGRSMEYCNALRRDRRLAPLRNKVPFFARNISLQHMSIQKRPDPAERQALFVLAENWGNCKKTYKKTCVRYRRPCVRAVDEYIVNTEDAILAAVNGRISLGRLNELRRTARVIFERRVDDTRRARRAEDERNRPTQCRWVGDVWTCRKAPRPGPRRVCCFRRMHDGRRQFWVAPHFRCERRGGRPVARRHCRR